MSLVQFDEPACTPPLFVLSCERSGSTLLRYLIDTHPDVASPGELVLGQLVSVLGRTLDRSIGQTLAGNEAERQRQTRLEIRRIADGILSSYARAKGKKLWCEKSPANWQFLEQLSDVFPDARYVVLHRNCMDVIHSKLEVSQFGFHPAFASYAAQTPDNFVEALAKSWLEKTRAIDRFAHEHPDQCLFLSYEELVFDPPRSLARVFRFFGVEYHADVFENVFRMAHDEGGGDPKIRFASRVEQSSVGKGSKIPVDFLSPETFAAVNETLAGIGYPTLGRDFNQIPNPYVRTNAPALAEARAGLDVASVFEKHVPARLVENAEAARAVDTTFCFVVEGEGGGVWRVQPSAAPGEQVRTGRGAADCTITLPGDVLLGIVRGEINGVTAFMEKKLSVQGEPRLAVRIGLFL